MYLDNPMKHLVCALLLMGNVYSAWSQERCGILAYEAQLNKNNTKRENTDRFESWMQQLYKKSAGKLRTLGENETQSTYVIPVVVHVVHNGEPVGTGINISDAQIASQIAVLNNDFKRLNADRVNTPSTFQSVVGSFDVEFVLAKSDPDCQATTGIRRVRGSKSTWSLEDNFMLKSQSYWPAEDYLNIWVCNLTGYLGYTQFPVSTLPGLESASNERLTDGIVIHYKVFGSRDDGSFDLNGQYNKGRTLTHEMGHFFGLRHIWGDGNCNATDYVSDTPSQSGSTSGCPSHPRLDCGLPQQPRMFQNYMDYTNDDCMNLFTQQQVDRMLLVLQNSPRRASLLTSSAGQVPVILPNDLGIKEILTPQATQCAGTFRPSITVRNNGSNTVTSAQIQLLKNNIPLETISATLNLATSQEVVLFFSPVSIAEQTTHNYAFVVLQTNGQTNTNCQNKKNRIVTTPATAPALPLFETFTSIPSYWNVVNPDGLTTWQTTSTPNGKTAIYLDFYDYAEVGATDLLTSPLVDLTASTKATLIFDRAYAPYPGVTGERLRILATTNCNFSNAVELFSKSDEDLATTSSQYSAYKPINHQQWVTEVIPLDAFVGSKLQIGFEGTNANGNNLYITNVRIVNTEWLDLSLVNLLAPSPVSCVPNPSPTLLIKNIGNIAITHFQAAITINGQALPPQLLELPLGVNEQKTVTLSPLTLVNDANNVSITLLQPNGADDNVTSNNTINQTTVLSTKNDIIPLRERFDSDTKNNWTIVSQPQQANWQIGTTNFQNSLVYNSFSNTQLGDESWLVSPVLNLKSTSQGSLFFNISYAKEQKGSESLRLLASSDCGLTFTDVLYNQSGNNLATISKNNSQEPPASPTEWRREYVALNNYAGKQNIRFAFVVTNGNGNNLYLDNIDFYIEDNVNPVVPDALYALYGGISSDLKVTFNLDARSDVHLVVYNTLGQHVSEFRYENVLNQTYAIDLGERSHGIYIVWVQIGSQISAKRVFFGN
jgi:hypothetical protein